MTIPNRLITHTSISIISWSRIGPLYLTGHMSDEKVSVFFQKNLGRFAEIAVTDGSPERYSGEKLSFIRDFGEKSIIRFVQVKRVVEKNQEPRTCPPTTCGGFTRINTNTSNAQETVPCAEIRRDCPDVSGLVTVTFRVSLARQSILNPEFAPCTLDIGDFVAIIFRFQSNRFQRRAGLSRRQTSARWPSTARA